ncbi:hypothetical protein PLICRDRAFT_44486 [Plicaturopsis crispa FD-325 SS-3]|nr:hypothetical protein PLICRDRAFT_44486 [Plicaturopsis crispa FD-325 SS-3]
MIKCLQCVHPPLDASFRNDRLPSVVDFLQLHEDHERDLAIANERIRKLQAENDLLLDAMNLAAPSQPALYQYIVQPHEPQAGPMYPHSHSPHAPQYMNGHTNGNGVSNGHSRHRASDSDPPDYIHEANGRM